MLQCAVICALQETGYNDLRREVYTIKLVQGRLLGSASAHGTVHCAVLNLLGWGEGDMPARTIFMNWCKLV